MGSSLVTYHCFPSPFGSFTLGIHQDAICFAGFTADPQEIQIHLPGVSMRADSRGVSPFYEQVFQREGRKLPLSFLKGTLFQKKVWQALRQIPWGEKRSYQQIAENIQAPSAIRAVASAIGRNPISFLVPCHRVIRSSGALGGYYWGLPLKEKLLAYETGLENL